MKIKVSEANTLQINWMVSTITNPEWSDEGRAFNTFDYVDTGDEDDKPYDPTYDWSQGGPIIAREIIDVMFTNSGEGADWLASASNGKFVEYGFTPLIAAMRCFVASKLGDEVDVPEELA